MVIPWMINSFYVIKKGKNDCCSSNHDSFLCRLPFWQRHIVFTVSSKNWHVLKSVFYGFLGLIYFIELKSINPKNSLCVSLSLSIYLFQVKVKVFCPSFLKCHIFLSFWSTNNLKTVLESFFWKLFSDFQITAVNRRFRRWHR